MKEVTQSPMTELIKRLDLIICLLLEQTGDGSEASMTDKIAKLTELGVTATQVAQILHKPVNYVTAAMAMRKKARRLKA